MVSRLAVHWQRTHPENQRDRAIFERWQPRSVKIITVDESLQGIEVIPRQSLLVARHHPLSEEHGLPDAATAREKGARHAAIYHRIAEWVRQTAPEWPWERIVCCGINEPHVWSDEPPEMTALYYAVLAHTLHRYGLRCGLLNLSVGWPANAGPDTPPIWGPFQAVLDVYREGDYLVLHEYWDERGPQHQWGWLAGRYRQCPWTIPILIGECGLDVYVSRADVAKERRGWRAWLSAQDYLRQLAWYDARLREDERIHSAQVFTYDYAHPWASFNIREEDFMERVFLPYVEGQVTEEAGGSARWGDDRTDRWRALCEKYGERYHLDPRLIGTVIAVESGGNPAARGGYKPVGEVGLMQVIPSGDGTAVNVGFEGRPTAAELLEPETNVRVGAAILAAGIAYFGGSVRKGLMAYNWGIGNVARHPEATDVPTTRYVAKFEAAWRVLWPGVPLPTVEGKTAIPPLNAIRWHAEEAVREIETMQKNLAATRERLLTQVIEPLYQHERGKG